MIRILIADDQELIRQSLQIVLGLEHDFEVIGTAGNGQRSNTLCEKTETRCHIDGYQNARKWTE